MRSHALRINKAVLKERIEANYMLERDLAYKSVVSGLIIVGAQIQLNMRNIVFEDSYYNAMFCDNYYINDLRTLLIRIGVVEPVLMIDHLEFLQEFLVRKIDPNRFNYISVFYDSSYQLNIIIKQTK